MLHMARLAGSLACIVTNPLEVAKTRKQLQGELLPQGLRQALRGCASAPWPPSSQGRWSASHSAAVWLRYGLPGPSRSLALRCLGARLRRFGGLCRLSLYLIKTRLQAQSSLAVGISPPARHLAWSSEPVVAGGLLSMWKGSTAQTARTLACLSAAAADAVPGQLPERTGCHFGHVTVDTLSTRIYNQPTVRRPRSGCTAGCWDALVKVCPRGSLTGLYKGAMAVFLRLGPHTVLSLRDLGSPQTPAARGFACRLR
uniref:Solute carrier family 25 member 47 n=1 Tax=Macrostomum lignano TaxID=282301 RepID=A0A1I8FFM2_9PLAT